MTTPIESTPDVLFPQHCVVGTRSDSVVMIDVQHDFLLPDGMLAVPAVDVFALFDTPRPKPFSPWNESVGGHVIGLVDNSSDIRRCLTAHDANMRSSERAAEFAEAALRAGDPATAAAALELSEDLESFAAGDWLEMEHLQETHGDLDPTQEDWDRLTSEEQDEMTDSYRWGYESMTGRWIMNPWSWLIEKNRPHVRYRYDS